MTKRLAISRRFHDLPQLMTCPRFNPRQELLPVDNTNNAVEHAETNPAAAPVRLGTCPCSIQRVSQNEYPMLTRERGIKRE